MPTPISRADAVDRVKVLSSYDGFPEVVTALVEAFVDDAARPDSEGRLPSDEDWSPTFDLNAAVATVFETKAALVANRYDTATDGQTLNRSQLVAHFTALGRMYRNRIASTLRKQPPS